MASLDKSRLSEQRAARTIRKQIQTKTIMDRLYKLKEKKGQL